MVIPRHGDLVLVVRSLLINSDAKSPKIGTLALYISSTGKNENFNETAVWHKIFVSGRIVEFFCPPKSLSTMITVLSSNLCKLS